MPGQLPIHVFTLACEDVREETRGKLALLGTYSENIYFKDHQMRMRSIVFYSRFSGGNGNFLVTAKLEGPYGELWGTQIKDSHFPKSKDSNVTNFVIGVGNINFKGEGRHHYEVYFDDIPDPIVSFSFSVYVRPEMFGGR